MARLWQTLSVHPFLAMLHSLLRDGEMHTLGDRLSGSRDELDWPSVLKCPHVYSCGHFVFGVQGLAIATLFLGRRRWGPKKSIACYSFSKE